MSPAQPTLLFCHMGQADQLNAQLQSRYVQRYTCLLDSHIVLSHGSSPGEATAVRFCLCNAKLCETQQHMQYCMRGSCITPEAAGWE
jgi:hypothetical protein